ncbi:hypothetical protein BH20ACT5_BH20ACT5_23770 [soil metagenome]
MLRPATPGDLADGAAFLARLVRLEDSAVVRLIAGADRVTLWSATLGVLLRRDLRGLLAPSDTTVTAVQLFAAVEAAGADSTVALPPARDGQWRRTLPPARDWMLLDEVPAEVIRRLAATAARLVREAPAPATAGEAVLDQQTLLVSAGGHEVSVPVRVVTALTRMGFLGPDSGVSGVDNLGSGVADPDVVRFGCTPTWLRAASRHGTVYLRRGGAGLALI